MKMGAALYSNKEYIVYYLLEECINGPSLENELLLREHTYYQCLKIHTLILDKSKSALSEEMPPV